MKGAEKRVDWVESDDQERPFCLVYVYVSLFWWNIFVGLLYRVNCVVMANDDANDLIVKLHVELGLS